MAKEMIKEYAEEVLKEIKDLRPEINASVQEVKKNNGVQRVGISVIEGDEGTGISPTIYVDEMFDELTPAEAAIKVLDVLDNAPTPAFDVSNFLDWDKVKEKVRVKLVGVNGNQEFPHIDVAENLQAVFYVPAYLTDGGELGSIAIHQNHIDNWGVTVEELYEKALENTPRECPETLKGMSQVLAEMMGAEMAELMCAGLLPPEDEQMFVLGNKDAIFGAATLLYPDALKNAAKKIGFFIILPSSIHEVILVKATPDCDPDVLAGMIKEVNAGQVKPEEVLSDRPYYFNGREIKVFTGIDDALSDTTRELLRDYTGVTREELKNKLKNILKFKTPEGIWGVLSPLLTKESDRLFYQSVINEAVAELAVA